MNWFDEIKKMLKLLLIGDTLIIFSVALWTPLYAIFVEELNGTVLDVGIAWAISMFVYAVLVTPFGLMADKHNKKWFLATIVIILFVNDSHFERIKLRNQNKTIRKKIFK